MKNIVLIRSLRFLVLYNILLLSATTSLSQNVTISTRPEVTGSEVIIINPEAKSVAKSNFTAFVYPNPFLSNFYLDVISENTSALKITIYDMIGKLIMKKTVRISEINWMEFGKSFSQGVYHIEISQGDYKRNLKLVKH